jgi:hypothetical protein
VWDVYVCIIFIYIYSKLHFYHFFVVQYSICVGLSVFLNYPCTHLPTVTPDNRQCTVHPTITSYNTWNMCLSSKLIAKMKQSNCSNTTPDQRSMQGESGLWIFWELLAYDKDLMVKLRTASFAQGGRSKFITRHTPWNSIHEFELTRQVEGGS